MRKIKLGLWGLITLVLLVAFSSVVWTPVAAQSTGNWRCVQINGSVDLNVRSGASVNFEVVVALAPGTRVEADYTRLTVGPSYNWVPVRFLAGDRVREGWAITPRLSPCPSGAEAEVTTFAAPAPITLEVLLPDEGVTLEGVNQDGILDRDEIAQVARSVVLVGTMRRNRFTGSVGTGTIITPEGFVLTNAHVVEDGEYAAIGLLNDLNDPPEFQYLADIIGYDADIDVALLAIRSDIDGDPVNVQDLNLPFVPATLDPRDVFRGDAIYIFGYPSTGDDYLVVTTGSIVSVENGDMGGERLPVWYRTDAELAPGNSGGLAVTGNGDFVGLPTFVHSEAQTGGRLGGIRPVRVALMAVLETLDATQVPVASSASTPPSFAGPEEVKDFVADLEQISVTHGVEIDGLLGLEIHLGVTLGGWADRDAVIYARVFYDDISAEPLRNADAPLRYRDAGDQVRTALPLTPCCDETTYDDLALFLPYEVLGLTRPGSTALMLQVGVQTVDGAWDRVLSWEFVSVTVR